MSTDFDTFCMSKHGAFIESMLGVRGCIEEDCVTPPNVEGTCCWEATKGWGTPDGGHVWFDSTCVGCRHTTAGTCRNLQRQWEEFGRPYVRVEWTPYHKCGVAGWQRITNGFPFYTCADWWVDTIWQDCPLEQGWCRLSDGPAAHATRDLCNSLGGEYHDPYPHPPDWEPTVPCCVYTHEGTRCFEWSAGECEAEGGTIMGDVGDSCDTVACSTRNFWGACCHGDATCADHVSPDDCHAQPGAIWHVCQTCDAIVCEEGACCLPNATCVDGLTSSACAVQDGLFQGPGTTCDALEIDCKYRITVPCCLPDGGCEDLHKDYCAALDGMAMGEVRCADVGECPTEFIGACCRWFGALNAECHMDIRHGCEPLGGTFLGEGTRCSQLQCFDGYGICCKPNGLCLEWPNMTRSICEGFDPPGSFIPQWTNLECADISCVGELGACCVHHKMCDRRPEGACGPQQGLWQGAGTYCNEVLCPETIGACCSSGGICYLIWQDQCENTGGVFKGEGTECADVDCGPTSSCCLTDGSCVTVGLMDCMAREGAWTYRPPGWPLWNCFSTSCDSGRGACCVSQRCLPDTTYQQCMDAGGKFFGDGTECGQARQDCTPGACCLPNGTCEYWTQAWCENRGGEWRGDYGDYFPKCRSVTGRPYDVDCSEPA